MTSAGRGSVALAREWRGEIREEEKEPSWGGLTQEGPGVRVCGGEYCVPMCRTPQSGEVRGMRLLEFEVPAGGRRSVKGWRIRAEDIAGSDRAK
jgi:hypothetical protein